MRSGVAAAAVLALAPALSAQDAIRIIPPDREHRERLSGRVEVQTLIIHPSITAVEFSLDARRMQRVTEKPFTTYIELAHPPREQELEVRGFDDQGNHLGSDRIVLNGVDVRRRSE